MTNPALHAFKRARQEGKRIPAFAGMTGWGVPHSLPFVLATVLVSAALAGCGGGGKTTVPPPPPPPSPIPVTGLPEDRTLTPGDTTIPAGESRQVGEEDGKKIVASCPAGGEDCVLTVAADGTAQSSGGTPTLATYTPITGLPEGSTLEPGTILAGQSRLVHSDFDTRTVVTCPADGEDCVLTVAAGGAAESTGGALRVVTYTTLYLPSGHTLAESTTIPAGESREIGYSRGRSHVLACPADGQDCVVTYEYGAAESTGGMTSVVVTASNEMVWQANNGPAGTSNGAHAKGLQGRLLLAAFDTPNALLRSDVGGRVKRAGAIVQNSKNYLGEPSRTVTPTATWASSDDAPTLELAVAGTGGGAEGSDFSVDEDSAIPSLGTGWNGVALGRTMISGRTTPPHTVHAVLYSNIEQQPEGGSADEYYLTLGAWLVLPKDRNAPNWQYNLGVFAQGHAATALTNTNLQALSGTATYEGPATGLYSKAAYRGSLLSRKLRSAKVGSFTATATINANFGGAGNFTGAQFAGSVTNFRENGEPLGEWTVDLNAGLSSTNEPASEPMTDDLFYGGTGGSADGQSLSGQWGVQFFRNRSGGDADYAVGTFTASTAGSNNDALHIVGAYGAESQ